MFKDFLVGLEASSEAYLSFLRNSLFSFNQGCGFGSALKAKFLSFRGSAGSISLDSKT
jgi:hypothetical protein